MTRTAAHAIESMFLERCSRRAMSGEALPHAELMRLFEAARWAPSWGNSQPWQLVWSARDTDAFDALLATLDEGNRVWVERAAALVLVCSTKTSLRPGKEPKPLPTHAFDTGAAWMALALQGAAMKLVVHAMGGFDHDAARAVCAVPEQLEVQCVVAIGLPGAIELLPEAQRAKEQANDRDPIEAHLHQGRFTG